MLSIATLGVSCLNLPYQRTEVEARGAEGLEEGPPWSAAGAGTLGAGWRVWWEAKLPMWPRVGADCRCLRQGWR